MQAPALQAWGPTDRDISREITQKHQTQAKVIYVNTSKEEVVERWQQNRKTNQRFDIRDEDFAQVADNFQAPTQDEDILVYDNSLPVRIWIQLYFD